MTAATAQLPIGIIRSMKVRPREGDRVGYIELQLRIPIDTDARAAMPLLLELQEAGAPLSATLRQCRNGTGVAVAAALRRP